MQTNSFDTFFKFLFANNVQYAIKTKLLRWLYERIINMLIILTL
jgi:hypothetical protein